MLEAAVAASVLAIFLSIGIAAMVRLNQWATSSRLQTLANALVQEKVREALYNPWNRSSDPWPVTPGTETGLMLNSEAGTLSFSGQKVLSVPAQRITNVQALPTEPDGAYRLLQITGTVKYEYMGKSFELPFATLRTCSSL